MIAACIWWLYFDYVGSSGLQIIPRASFFWGYGHLPIYAGIAASGVGILLAIEGAAETTAHGDLGVRAILGGGLAVYLLAVKLHPLGESGIAGRPRSLRAARNRCASDPRRAARPFISPLVFAALTALALLALTTFETLSADVPGDPPVG